MLAICARFVPLWGTQNEPLIVLASQLPNERSSIMKIATVESGNFGAYIGLRRAEAGHKVMFSYSRDETSSETLRLAPDRGRHMQAWKRPSKGQKKSSSRCRGQNGIRPEGATARFDSLLGKKAPLHFRPETDYAGPSEVFLMFRPRKTSFEP